MESPPVKFAEQSVMDAHPLDNQHARLWLAPFKHFYVGQRYNLKPLVAEMMQRYF